MPKKRGLRPREATKEFLFGEYFAQRHLATKNDEKLIIRQHYLAINARLKTLKSQTLPILLGLHRSSLPSSNILLFHLEPPWKNCQTIELRELMMLVGRRKQDMI